MPVPKQIKGRYEIRQVLGQGGMGVVYAAFDTVVKRTVAVKTVRDTPNRTSLDLFFKECDVLASMSHPNIVEIFDLGEFDEDGVSKPYFVMPLLPGKTLSELIASRSSRLNVGRVVEMICQTCRGLQAAHERGLVHRDLKPSNILVMDDDSVKIIDFGIAHMADAHSTVGHKGTLLYMAPEQVEMQAPSALSDIFSLGVVSFEAITFRHPFERGSAAEVASAIRKHIPPPASELNPLVNGLISRVIHKSMAKQPWYRFGSARELSEALQKAVRNEPIEIFDPARIQPRIERVRKTFQQGDYQFADEILTELEVEGYFDEAISSLRHCLNDAQRRKIVDQLLDSARTRAEQQEYPLALQKIQELLALDPTHNGALELKSAIENKRSEQKIEDWFRLAHQHMDQNAFSHARQALQNVLQVRPRDTRALKLMSEVDRCELEFVRMRHEQDRLYANAMEAWQSGEISAALSKLERLVALDRQSSEGAAHERSATFQNFYNQVRSEHDAMKGAYERARNHVADGNFDAALEICNEQQVLHPGQALFQSLKFDIEERQRQELSHRIAEVDRLVETEVDLEKRVNILTEALERSPGEVHFERALRTMREKRDLVNSIVSKARSYEDRTQYADALGQWEIVRTIYSQYPGLDFEMERVRRRRDQQLRSDAKTKWVQQIDWLLGTGDYTRANELLKSAAAEFPDDSELLELGKLAAQGAARAMEAQRLLAEAQELAAQSRVAEGIEVLRRAHEADNRNAVIRIALTGMLVDQARISLDSDWRAAETLAQQALELDPENAEAKSLRTLVLDRKREEFVDSNAAQVRRLQNEGQIEVALQRVEEALVEYPRESRLLQLRATLVRAHAESRKSLAAAATGSAAQLSEADATQTVLAPPPQPAEPPSPRPADEPVTVAAPPPEASAPPPVAPSVPEIPPRPPARLPASRGKRIAPILLATLAIAALLIIGAALATKGKRPRATPPAAKSVPVAAAPVPAAPVPPKAALRVYADLETGRIILDDQPAGELHDGVLVLENLVPGTHTLKIGGFHEQATVTFSVAEGIAPAVTSVAAKEAVAITIASANGRATVQSNLSSAKLSLDGAAVGEMAGSGVELNGVAPGNHELALGEGKERRSVIWSADQAPSLTAFLKSDRNVGTIVIVTGEDGVRVSLNGKEQSRKTQNGRLRISDLDVKEYAIRVVKDGFLDTPQQQVSIRKGEEIKLEFHLQPLPKVASLVISGGIPGAEVLLDQTPIGTVRDDGSFTSSSVAPGDHVIEFRKESYKARRAEKRFEPGGAVRLDSTEAAMEKLQGTIRIKLTPADAQVTISRSGEGPKPFAGSAVNLPEGSYTLIARAPNYVERSTTLSLAAGETKDVELVLERVSSRARQHGMADWDDPGGWSQTDNWYSRKGGNFVGFKPAQTAGTFTFTIRLDKGRRLQWAVGRIDDRNFALFQMDKKSFYRAQVVAGKETLLKKISHPFEKQPAYTFQMDVTEDAVIHKLWDGSKWLIVDEWSEPGRKFGTGKFGFILQGSDAMRLSNFSFVPK